MENQELRETFESQFRRAYLDFKPPVTAPNFVNLLPKNFQYADLPGYEDFCVAFELEYDYGLFDEARQLYEHSSNQGHPLANYSYGLWYLAGDRPGTPKDLRKAFQKFCLAHKSGLGQAAYQLADYYRTGKGKVVNRDVKKSYAFLVESISDPRIHRLFDGTPYWMLGLAHGLERGPPLATCWESARCLCRATRYSNILEYFVEPSVDRGPKYRRDYEMSDILHLAHLMSVHDRKELEKRISVRLKAIDEYLQQFPPGYSMMTLPEFIVLARKFGLDYNAYLLNAVEKGKESKCISWEAFQRKTEGKTQPLYVYETQPVVERLLPLLPDDEETKQFVNELEAQFEVALQQNAQLSSNLENQTVVQDQTVDIEPAWWEEARLLAENLPEIDAVIANGDVPPLPTAAEIEADTTDNWKHAIDQYMLYKLDVDNAEPDTLDQIDEDADGCISGMSSDIGTAHGVSSQSAVTGSRGDAINDEDNVKAICDAISAVDIALGKLDIGNGQISDKNQAKETEEAGIADCGGTSTSFVN